MNYSDVHAAIGYNGATLSHRARRGPREAIGEAVIMVLTLQGQLNVRALVSVRAHISHSCRHRSRTYTAVELCTRTFNSLFLTVQY